MNGKERVLAMFDGRPVDHLPLMPITMMFATDLAGVRYRDYAADHRVLAEAQLRVAREFGFDHVSAISDPAREVADLGGAVEWFDDQPPAVVEGRALLADKARLKTLSIPELTAPGRMLDRVEAVALLKGRTVGALIVEGWVEGPCALGADLRGLNTLMFDFHDDPEFVTALFEFAVAMELDFAGAQIAAGADVIGIGDAAASLIGPRLYEPFVLPFERKLVAGIQALGARVRLHICGSTRKILRGMGSLGADLVDLDFLCPMAEGRAVMGPHQALLGNLDPVRVIRDGTPEQVTRAVAECLEAAGPRYVVGAGCEVPRGTPRENLLALTEFARSHRP
jgi:MtaA/CmuA family methyltransferase